MYKKQKGNRTAGDRAKYERNTATRCDNPDIGKQKYWIEVVDKSLTKTEFINSVGMWASGAR